MLYFLFIQYKGAVMNKPNYNNRDKSRGNSVKDYWPLISLILVSLTVAQALASYHNPTPMAWMHYFMGFFLSVFALLKLFHPSAFADGFKMYDIIAKRYDFYAYLYPLIELGLGLAYFNFWFPATTYLLTIFIMALGSIGVINALQKGLDINCPCMGSILDVPLSTVTLTENISMGIMALIMLIMMIGV
jgi:hypothetical protein